MVDRGNNSDSNRSPLAGGRGLLLLFPVALAILLLLLGRNALIGAEGDLADITRRLLGQGDMFAPGTMTENYLMRDRSAAVAIKALAWFFGLSEWCLRLPAVLAALATLAGTVILAARMSGKRSAVCAGWMLLGSYGFLYWGRICSFSMFGAAALVWSVIIFYNDEPRQKISFGKYYTYFLILFSVFLLLGLLPAIPLLIVPAVRFSYTRSWRRHCCIAMFAAFFSALSSAAAAAVILCSDLAFSGAVAEDLSNSCGFLLQLVNESWIEFISGGIKDEWYQELVNVPRLLLPWTPLTLIVLTGFVRHRRELTEMQSSLLLSVLLIFLCIGIFPGRRWGVQLPLLPLLTVLTAAGLSMEINIGRAVGVIELAMRYFFMIAASLAVALLATWPLWDLLFKLSPPLVMMVLVPILGLGALFIISFGTAPGHPVARISGTEAPLGGTILAGVCLMTAVLCVLYPALTRFRTGRLFWKKSGSVVRHQAPGALIFYNDSPNSLALYYMDLPWRVAVAGDRERLFKLLRDNPESSLALVAHKQDSNMQTIAEAAKESGRLFIPDEPAGSEGMPLRLYNSGDDPEKEYGLWILKRESKSPAMQKPAE